MIVTVTPIGLHQLKDAQGTVVAESVTYESVLAAAAQQPAGTYLLETQNESVLVEDEPPPPPPPTYNHPLAIAAAAMQPGQAIEFTSPSINVKVNGLRPTEGAADLPAIDWSVKGGWDTVGQRFTIACQPPGLYPSQTILLTYDAYADNWFAVREPWAGIGFGHGYDGNAFDPVGRIHHKNDHKLSNAGRLLRWDAVTQQPLAAMSPPTNFGFTWNTECAITWVPWGEQGGLVYAGGKNGGGAAVALWDKATDTWSLKYNGAGFGGLECVCHYNPTADRVVFGYAVTGGVLRIMDSAGSIITTQPTPTNVNAGSPGNYVFVPHPGNGTSLVYANNDLHTYGLGCITGEWTDYGARTWMTNSGHDCGVSIPEHGVVMFVKYDYGNTKVWLHKPA